MQRKNIREFDCIRNVIAHIYTYGFFTREKFILEKAVGSPRAYDDIIRQLRDLYYYDMSKTETVFSEDPNIGGYTKQYRFRRDYFSHPEDTLAAAYGLYAIKDDAIAITVRCFSHAASLAGATVTSVSRISEDENGSNKMPTVSRRLKDLKEAGYLVNSKSAYHLNADLSGLTDDELVRLYYLVSFYSGAGYPRIPSVFLIKALKRHFLFRKLPIPTDAFLFRDNVCGNVFDEQVVYLLLQCCQKNLLTELSIHETVHTVKPVFLKIDSRMGRWYLFAVEDSTPMIIRISRVKKLKPTNKVFDRSEAEKILTEAYQHSHISAAYTDAPLHVEAELMFDSPAMRNQFEREMILGQIEKRGDTYIYCADVGDLTEVKPFLRSYGAYLRILPSSQHNLDKEIKSEYERMLGQYGTV